MPRFCSLFSSSSGNCTYLGTAKNSILIDAGASAKKIKQALSDRDVDLKTLRAIFVTHEHSDHIKGIRVLASSLSIPVFATAGTLEGLEEAQVLNGKFPFEVIDKNGAEISDMLVKPFKTSHDSRESCGYTVEFSDGTKASVATDTGCVTDEVMKSILGSNLVLLESNHDVGMLENGFYPYYLKRRILSDEGHLSNEACSFAAAKLIEKGTSRLFLGHLSTENNMPQLAYQTSYAAIYQTGAVLDRDYTLEVNPKENFKPIVRF